MSNKTVYLVMSDTQEGETVFIGIFDSEEKAVAACRTTAHCYGKFLLNEDLGDTPEEGFWRYPKAEEAEREAAIRETPKLAAEYAEFLEREYGLKGVKVAIEVA